MNKATLALVLAVWFAVLQFGRPPDDTMYWNALFDTGHALGFGVVVWALERMLSLQYPRLGVRWRLLSAAGLALVLAALSEIVQLYDSRRHASLGDLGRDAAGIVAFLAFWGLQRRGDRRPGGLARVMLATLLAGASAVALIPWLLNVVAYRQRDAACPAIVTFDPEWEEHFLMPNNAIIQPMAMRPEPGRAEPLARLTLQAGKYPGFSINEPCPDWRGFDRLVVGVYVPGTADLDLVLRIHDSHHTGHELDRFNRTLNLHPGWQQISIKVRDIEEAPAGRRLDLAEIRGLSLFAPVLDAPVEVYLAPLRLRSTG